MKNYTGGLVLLLVAVVIMGGVIIYGVSILNQHSSQLDCLTRAVNQALNEAFHHAKLSPPVCQ